MKSKCATFLIFALGATLAQAQQLVWAQNGTDQVQTSDLNGNNLTSRTPTLGNPWGVAVWEDVIYFSEDNDEKIWRMNADGAGLEMIIDQPTDGIRMPRDLHVADGLLYWNTGFQLGGSIQRSNLDGSDVQTLATVGGFLQGIFVSDQYIYWTDSNFGSQRIGRTSLDGANTDVLINTGLNIPYGIWATNTYLYWADLGTDTIHRANLDGSGAITLIDAFAGLNNPSGIMVHDERLYFTQQYSGVYAANLDGSGITPLVTGLSDVRFLDVIPASVPEPAQAGVLLGFFALSLGWSRRRA